MSAMSSEQQHSTGPARSAMPHPAVIIAALMLALAGAWCVVSGQVDDDSEVALSVLREQVARSKSQFLRAGRQAADSRSRLLAAQDQLQRYTVQQYAELQH